MNARADMLLEPIGRTASIIEIGPSINPIAPKAKGWNAKTIDVATKSQLIEKYKDQQGVDLNNIEEVDFLWRDGPLCTAVPPELHGTFDAFIASHVIEHTPDLVDFLDSAATLLAPTGIAVLVVPDKRFCFDYFRPLTLTGDVLAAHEAHRSRHSKETLFQMDGYLVNGDNSFDWGPHPINEIRLVNTLDYAYSRFQNSDESSLSYTDAHAWVFTPASFQLVMLELARLKVTDWRVDRIAAGIGCEFSVWLRHGGAAAAAALSDFELNVQRLALLKQTLVETREQVGFLTSAQSAVVENAPAFQQATAENATLRAALTEKIADCEALEHAGRALAEEVAQAKAVSQKWFEATIAITPEHHPRPRTSGAWWNFLRRLNRHRRLDPIVLAKRARASGEWELAVRYYRDALDRKPDEPGIWVQCGGALKETGKFAEAEAAYRKALELDANRADTNAALGYVLALQGRSAEAAAAYRTALALAPAPPLRHALLEVLNADRAAALD